MTRTHRIVTALPGLFTIVALLVGGPVALVWWAGFPLPRHNPSADQWTAWLDHPLTKTFLIDTVAIIMWIGWALILYVVLAACVTTVAKVRLPMPRLAVPLHTALAGLVGVGVIAANTGAASAATAVVTVQTPSPRPLAAVVPRSGHDVPRTVSSDPVPSTADGSQVLATGVDGQVTVKAGGQHYSVTVHRHDTLWKLAGTWLGDPTRWPEIYHLNRAHYDQHGQMHHGNLILPGWILQLPDDATPPAGAHPVPAPAVEAPAPATTNPQPAATTPTPAVATPTSPISHSTAPEQPSTKSHQPTDAGDEVGIYAGLAGAGLLSALLLGAVRRRRRRQQQHRRPQRRLPHPREGATERALRVVEQPADVDRLDVALRALAAGLADHEQSDLPDMVGAWIVGGNVNVLLAAPCPHAPVPWIDEGNQWTLPASAELTDVDGAVAPLPALITVGSRPGRHLLLDLERAGSLSLDGDAPRARSLLRYLASELACNSWSDDVEVILAGFDPDEAELLVALNPDRVRAVSTVGQAVTQLRRRVTTATSTLRHVGAQDALAGRIGDLAGDAWMPQVLLAADPDQADVVALRLLARDLAAAGRCGVAVATNGPALLDASDSTQLQVSVAADGTLRVVGASVDASAAAAGLPVEELEPLAEIMRQAREIADVAVPVAPETEGWATGTDAAGALLELFESAPTVEEPLTAEPVSAPPAPIVAVDPWLAELAAEEQPHRLAAAGGGITAIPSLTFARTRRPVTAAIRQRRREADPHLDQDLKAWMEDDAGLVRVGILGPVIVAAPGDEPVERRRFLAEIIVFLAQRGARGATGEKLTDALWPEGNVKDASRRVAITRSRRWLGNTPTGDPWLPDMGADRTYRLEDGYLLDWHLFRRLRTRGEAHGPAGVRDLRAALELVRGAPLDGADRAYAIGSRNPYTWLPESDIYPGHIVSAIVDTAHELAELYLEAGATTEARWAVHQAWLADPYRGDDELWRDIMRAEHMDGHSAQLRRLLGELIEARDAEVPEDLSKDTYAWLRSVIPHVLGASTST